MKAGLPDILFEDEALLAFDKPSGLLISFDRWNRHLPNLMQMVHTKLSPDIFNVHRLDRDTSGVVLCAKNRPALNRLVRAFETREVGKRYLAIVSPVPEWEEKTVALNIILDPDRPGKVKTTRHGGRRAVTQFRVSRRWRGYALVEAQPLTGRTHQIRVHLAAAGAPVVADRLYGAGQVILLSALKRGYKTKAGEPERPLLGRVALHSASLTFRHPVTGSEVTIEAPVPHDFEVAIKYLDKFAR